MSTITSPRPSVPSTSKASSPTTSRTTSPAPPTRRANRSALRDYYNLKPSSPTTATTTNSPAPQPRNHSPAPQISPLDEPNFDPEAYIASVLASQPLSSVLKTESALINEIKGLDGERKALVYDNYSKLITATDTIRRMRERMDPLTPTTGTLGMGVGYIAEMAGALAEKGKVDGEGAGGRGEGSEVERKRRERDTVRWILGTPGRLGKLMEKGAREEAGREWDEVRGILERWKGVKGVGELREECERVMGGS